MMDAPTLAALIVGLLVGTAAGVLTMCLVRVGQPIGALTVSDLTGAYLMGYQDAVDGHPADTTRPADLGP